MEVAEMNDVVASYIVPKNQPQDEILETDGIHPVLIPHVIKVMLDSKRLSVDDLKSCRLVCTDWSTPAKTVLSKICRITINGKSGMRFTDTFFTGPAIPSRDCKLVEYDSQEDNQDFMTNFFSLFDWPGLEIESLILSNSNDDDGNISFSRYSLLCFLEDLSMLLKKTGNLKHLAFQYWDFNFTVYYNQYDLDKVIENGSKVKRLSLNNCRFPVATYRIQFPFFNAVFPELDAIDFSNLDGNESGFGTNILPETLVTSFAWSNIKTLNIPELNTDVIFRFNQTDLNLKHFHADVMRVRETSIVAWTEFWTKQNELESFSINNLCTESNCLGPIGYRIPRMENLRRLHIGGNGYQCLLERYQILETCPNLNELGAGWLPEDMICTNHQITSLTLDKPDVWYWGWFEDLTTVLKEFGGLKYLTIKLHRFDRDSVVNSISNIFPDLLLKIIP